MTRDSREARVALDVLVSRDDVVAATVTMAVVVLAVAGVGLLLACFCFERARRAQDRRVDEIMREADEINRKADAAAASPARSSRSGDV